MRWLPIILAASTAACVYDMDWFSERDPASDAINCSATWDCLEDGDICASIVSGDHSGSPCSDQQAFLGLDDYEIRFDSSFDYQDSIHFVCIASKRYFPYCTKSNDRHCDGTHCPSGVCATRLDAPDKALCVSKGDLGPQCFSDNPGACPTGHEICVRFFEWGTEGPLPNPTWCVSNAAIQ